MQDAGDLVGPAQPSDRDRLLDAVEDLLRDVLEHLGRDEPGGDGVDGDADAASVSLPARLSWNAASSASVLVSPKSPDLDAA
jgi:hypothetical protein